MTTEAQRRHAIDLMDLAAAAGERLKFHGYTLWKCEDQQGAWDVTNPYGVDNCARLKTVDEFEWFLAQLRAGAAIGPTPPGCDDADLVELSLADRALFDDMATLAPTEAAKAFYATLKTRVGSVGYDSTRRLVRRNADGSDECISDANET